MTSLTTRKVKSRAWFFTWDNPPENFLAQIINEFQNYEYICQKERSLSGLVHIQGVMRYPTQRYNWPDLPCHWERCRNWRAAIKYCSKVDTRIDGPWTNIPGMTWRKSIISPLDGKILFPWQVRILELIKENPDDRKIYWYWDSIGCTGKTSLAKHIRITYGKKWLYVNGASRDILCALIRRLENFDIDGVIFGITRQDASRVSYRSIEIIKDGIGFNAKYESDDFLMSPPHVLIFANFPPDKDMLSADRWVIEEINSTN